MAVVFLLAIFIVHIIQGYLIERRVDHQRNTLNDSIVIPDSMCTSGGASQCLSLGARHAGHCRCECKDKSKTFVFLDGHWNCTENEQIRLITDCPMKLASNVEPGFEIFTVPANPKVTIEYTAPIPGFDPLKCGFYRKNEYLLCDGKWKEFDRKSFDVAGKDNAKLIPKLNNGSFPYGRVMQLYITCYSDGSLSTTSCILLKVEGTQNCPSTIPSTAAPPAPPATIRAITTSSLPISNPVSIPARSFPGQTSAPSSTLQTTTQQITILSTINPQSKSTTLQTTPFLKNTRSSSTADSSGTLIAGVTVGAVVLIVILVAILIVRVMRRRRRLKSLKNTATADNEGYNTKGIQSFPKDDEEYAYAYSEAPVKKPQKNKESQASVTNRVYGLTEEVISKDFNNDPFYNTLENPEYAKPDTSSPGQKPKEKNTETFYHTLEGPDEQNPNNEPVYNELEAPVSEEPSQYMALGKHVPHVYGKLVRPGSDQKDTHELHEYDTCGSIII